MRMDFEILNGKEHYIHDVVKKTVKLSFTEPEDFHHAQKR